LDKDKVYLLNLSSRFSSINLYRLTTMKIKSIVVFVAAALLSAACDSPEKEQIADKVYLNGNIYTVAADNKVEAVATLEGKIIFAGSRSDLDEYIGDETEQIDLGGMTMTPGFIESHGHLMGLGHGELNLDLNGIKNYDEMVELVAEAVEKVEPGEWILGRGWHQSKWDEQQIQLLI